MRGQSISMQPRNACVLALLAAGASLQSAGCGKPNQANIVLRKDDQKLTAQVAALQHQHEADQAMIAALRNRIPDAPSLPPGELDKLFTVHGITFGRLTGAYAADSKTPGGLKIYIVPVDQDSQPLKSAGSFVIEAFDLAAADPRIGRWTFNLEEARKQWYGHFLLDYYYVLPCPWQSIPQHPDLTLKVTFTDELTKLPFTAQRPVKVNLPPPAASTRPGS